MYIEQALFLPCCIAGLCIQLVVDYILVDRIYIIGSKIYIKPRWKAFIQRKIDPLFLGPLGVGIMYTRTPSFQILFQQFIPFPFSRLTHSLFPWWLNRIIFIHKIFCVFSELLTSKIYGNSVNNIITM